MSTFHKPIRAAGLLCCFLVASCNSLPRYDAGNVPSEVFASNERNCRAAADHAAGAYDDAADRYDDGSAAQQIGALLGSGLAETITRKRTYKRCMEAAGYAPAVTRQARETK